MADIITQKYKEWTEGSDPVRGRISIFEHIRDIPYAVVAELRDPHTGPSRMLEINRGSCVPKHFLMAKAFALHNIPVKYASYLFSWDDPSVKYPNELRVLAQKMPVSAHLAIKANIDGKWVLLDATWDPKLAKLGFPVNDNWDGMSETVNAVKPLSEVLHEDIAGRVKYSSDLKTSYSKEEIAVYDEFAKKLNTWLDKARAR